MVKFKFFFILISVITFVKLNAQMSVFVPLPDTEYNIINVSSGNYLTSELSGDVYFAKHLIQKDSSRMQRFVFEKLPDNTYNIKCVETGLYMYRSSNGWDVKFSTGTTGSAIWNLEEYDGKMLIKLDWINHFGIDTSGDGVFWNKTWSATSRLQWRFVTVVKNPLLASDISYPVEYAEALTEEDWGIPSWTKMMEAYRNAKINPSALTKEVLRNALLNMKRNDIPYAVNAVINGDPATRIGLAWYTNKNITGGMAQLIDKPNASETDFENPVYSINAVTKNINNIFYLTLSHSDISNATGVPIYHVKSYTSNKVLITGLTPDKVYSYRVGMPGAWSDIRTFKTGSVEKNDFTFLYITDTQSNNVEDFEVSKMTIDAATMHNPNADFIMVLGDMIESVGYENSEWEYEKWFEIMDNVLSRIPMVLTNGNHDLNANLSLSNHTNTDYTFDSKLSGTSTMPGMTYSFVKGDALFFVVNFEDYYYSNFYNLLDEYMSEKIAAHPDIKWRILCCHAGMYTGSIRHHDSSMAREIRRYFSPLMQKHRIDLALHGHSHVYEVIGPVDNFTKTIIPNSVSAQEIETPVFPENITGKRNGIFDVSGGTLYFLNNSAGKKKYAPLTKEEIENHSLDNEVPDYWSLFSGRFSQTNEPAFSNVTVTKDTIKITTFTVKETGNAEKFDEIKIVRNLLTNNSNKLSLNDKLNIDYTNKTISFEGEMITDIDIFDINSQLVISGEKSNRISFRTLAKGVYFVRVNDLNGLYSKKIFVY